MRIAGVDLTYGSVCSGIEGATVAWGSLGWRAAFYAEVDPFCSALLEHHYPETINHGDFTKIRDGAVDLLVGGTPCQSFSVAGKRAGLDDARGNLTLEYLALAGRIRPRWLVWENVPGVLSIDGGRTFTQFLDTLNELGYSAECDILDACHFGVPQRRRRVFVIGFNVADGRKRRMPYFASLASTCLTDLLLSVLADHCDPSSIAAPVLAWPSRYSDDGIRKRTRLFALSLNEADSLANLWIDMVAAFPSGVVAQDNSESPSKQAAASVDIRSSTEGGRLSDLTANADDIGTSTRRLWSEVSVAVCAVEKRSTTSTSTSLTTESTIFTCARALLSIAAYTSPLSKSFPNLFDADSSGLTALKAFTNYARQADRPLLRGLVGFPCWPDFVRPAEKFIGEIERHLGSGRSGSTLFPVAASLSGHPAPSRETGQDVARCVATGTNSQRYDWETETFAISGRAEYSKGLGTLRAQGGDLGGGSEMLVAKPLTAHKSARNNGGDETFVTHSLRADGFDASEDGTGRGTPLVASTLKNNHGGGGFGSDPSETFIPIAFDYKQSGETDPTMRALGHDKSHANGGGHLAVAFPINTQIAMRHESLGRGTGFGTGGDGDPSFTLQANHSHAVGVTSGVRRLTPTECERLQGFSDDYTAIPYRGKPASDGPRYRALGNSFAVPVVRWIGERIAMVERIDA